MGGGRCGTSAARGGVRAGPGVGDVWAASILVFAVLSGYYEPVRRAGGIRCICILIFVNYRLGLAASARCNSPPQPRDGRGGCSLQNGRCARLSPYPGLRGRGGGSPHSGRARRAGSRQPSCCCCPCRQPWGPKAPVSVRAAPLPPQPLGQRRAAPGAGSLRAPAPHPDRLAVAALGEREETSRAGRPRHSPAALCWPSGAGSVRGRPSSHQAESGCREAAEQPGVRRNLPASLAAAVAAVDTWTDLVLVAPGCRGDRCSSSSSSKRSGREGSRWLSESLPYVCLTPAAGTGRSTRGTVPFVPREGCRDPPPPLG